MLLTGFVAEIREKLGNGGHVPADAIIDCASRRQMVKDSMETVTIVSILLLKPELSVAVDRLPSFFIHETSSTFPKRTKIF